MCPLWVLNGSTLPIAGTGYGHGTDGLPAFHYRYHCIDKERMYYLMDLWIISRMMEAANMHAPSFRKVLKLLGVLSLVFMKS